MRPARRPRPCTHRRRTLIGLAGLAALAALAACGDNGSAKTADTGTTAAASTTGASSATTAATATSTTAPPTTAAPATSTTAATTTSTTAAPTSTAAPTTSPAESDTACGTLEPLLDSANIIGSVAVDWDGAGNQDYTAVVYETTPGNGDFRLRVFKDDGTGSEMAIITDGNTQPQVLGTAQADFSLGTGTPQPEELLVSVGTNSSGYNVAVYYKTDDGCLGRFKAGDGSDLVLPIHASIGAASGLACEGAAGSQFLVRTTATASGAAKHYDVHDIRLRREGDKLVDDTDVPGSIVDDGSPTSPLVRYSSITNCNISGGD